jgi:hypothetical protein
MLRLRFGLCLCFALAGVLASTAPVRAQLPADEDARASEGGASVVLVGAAGRDSELKALLSELLERRGVRARISAQEGFGREQLLNAGRSNGVSVFVVPGVEGNVRLYFRAPDGERFLRRSVQLRAGFDEVGRELVGQVVETAVASLLHSGDGLTREQAQLALSDDESATTKAEPDEAVAATSQPPSTPAEHASTQHEHARTTVRLEGWLALRYGAVALGPELGVAHGPGDELGLALRRGYVLRSRVIFERDFPRSFGTSRIAAELSRTRLRFALDAGLELTTRQALLVSLGIGQDRVVVTPTAPAGSRIAPASVFPDYAPVALAELRYEARLGHFRVAAALGADISLVQTHYDIEHTMERESVAEAWLVRPSASLALAFSPRLAEF